MPARGGASRRDFRRQPAEDVGVFGPAGPAAPGAVHGFEAGWIHRDHRRPARRGSRWRAHARHIARRVFERLRKEHGCTGGDTIVKDCLREHDRSGHEMFVPLAHAPGMPRPTSRRRCASSMASSRRRFPLPSIFRTAMPVPSGPILRRHPRPAATGMFTQSTAAVVCRSHDLPCNRHGRPGKGNEKGSAERLAGCDRRNVLGPVARFPSWTAVDASLEAQCRKQASGRRSARPQREDRRGPCPGSRGDGGTVASPL